MWFWAYLELWLVRVARVARARGFDVVDEKLFWGIPGAELWNHKPSKSKPQTINHLYQKTMKTKNHIWNQILSSFAAVTLVFVGKYIRKPKFLVLNQKFWFLRIMVFEQDFTGFICKIWFCSSNSCFFEFWFFGIMVLNYSNLVLNQNFWFS